MCRTNTVCLEWITARGVKKIIVFKVMSRRIRWLNSNYKSVPYFTAIQVGGGGGGGEAIGFNCATHLFDYIHVN